MQSKRLRIELSQALKGEINNLPIGLQKILVDDLITAFENRYTILSRAQSKTEFAIEIGLSSTIEV
jgi:hypothetical protein